MPTCLYHGSPQPCRTCLINGMGQFAHRPPRGGVCPYHNKAHPCIDCYDNRMGQFAHASGSPIPAPRGPLYVPPARRHNHGSQRPCKIRCGVNEGLYIRNNQVNAAYLYTDSLLNCAQVIFRNSSATFTTHVMGGAPQPRRWIDLVYGTFVRRYGPVTLCLVVTSESPATGNQIVSYLRLKVRVTQWHNCDGCAIRISDGHVKTTPSSWNISQADVAGWLTAEDLMDLRLDGSEFLGAASYGDYYEPCRACNQ